MKKYDLIVIGTGSGLEIASAALQENPKMKIAVIDKDQPGGICLTRGCIPSKLLIYPADVVRIIQKSEDFGVYVEIKKIDFQAVMKRMQSLTQKDIKLIRNGLSNSKNIDYYPKIAEFISAYTLKIDEDRITSDLIVLGTGSKPSIPPVEGLEKSGYLTSATLLKIKNLPKSIGIIGGGYIAAEFGHFLSAMGSNVTIIGRNPQFIPEEEPEVSALALRELKKRLTIFTNHEVRSVESTKQGKKLIMVNRENSQEESIIVDEILVATGRSSNSDILHPEKAGIKTDQKGFIEVNDYLETAQSHIYACGDANGKYMFKHVANYEAQNVFYNAILKNKIKINYQAIPHAVFTEPEIASVGLKEKEAIEKYGQTKILIGFYYFKDTAKGEAMNLKNEFVKIIIEREKGKILGAHIIGPQASVLIQEIINLMNTKEQSVATLIEAMHIHPALPEVVFGAFRSLKTPEQYSHFLNEHTDFLKKD